MTGFAVYSATPEPDCLYSTGELDGVDAETTAGMVWSGDQPLDLVVDLAGGRVWWTFEAQRETKSTRTGYFIGAYSGEHLFDGFESQLRALHGTDEWAIPYAADPRWDAGLELSRIAPAVDGADSGELDRLVYELRDESEPIQVGFREYRSALQLLRALEERDLACTVVVDGDEQLAAEAGVDLFLFAGAARDFERPSSDTLRNGAATGDETSTVERPLDSGCQGRQEFTVTGMTARIAGSMLAVLCIFAAYSLVTGRPVPPLIGLSTYGAFLGTLGAVGVWAATAADRGSTAGEYTRIRDLITVPFRIHGERAIVVVALGTFAGFVYPAIFWMLGLLVGQDGFLLGSIASPVGVVVTAAVFVGLLFAIALGAMGVGIWRDSAPTALDVGRLVLAFGVYTLCLVVSTGLANSLWYGLIPAR